MVEEEDKEVWKYEKKENYKEESYEEDEDLLKIIGESLGINIEEKMDVEIKPINIITIGGSARRIDR